MNYSEDDLLPISALQHLLFCERQYALIHIEQMWEENRLTAEGRVLHERVHKTDDELRGNMRIARGVRLRSLRLGLTGQADVVEFHRHGKAWLPFPVEYKRGKPKRGAFDEVQLCAQAMCLEEMINCHIPQGALFYGLSKRRQEVALSRELRETTKKAAKRLHDLVKAGVTPPARFDKRCKKCSLLNECMPQLAGKCGSAQKYLSHILESVFLE